MAKKLIQEHGLPDIIYCSPYYRTRQTRKRMVKAIEDYKKHLSENHEDKYKRVKLQTEPRLGRFSQEKKEEIQMFTIPLFLKELLFMKIGETFNDEWKNI